MEISDDAVGIIMATVFLPLQAGISSDCAVIIPFDW